MSLISANGKFIALATINEIKWRNSSLPFNTLNLPFEVNCVDENCEDKSPINKSYDHFIKDLSFSEDGAYLIALTSSKEFYVYTTDDFTILYKHQLPRAASKVAFSFDSQFILVADKTGDVLIYKTKDQNDPGRKIFGHLSLLTDILMSRDNKFIITCDRDEKIKVSNYPGSYNIESFCLGHEEFITSLHFLPHNEKYLISASGDGSVRIWDYLLGKEVCMINVHSESSNSEVFTNFKDVMKIEDVEIHCLPIANTSCCVFDESSSLLAVSLHLSKAVIIYKITGENTDIVYNCLYNVTLEDCPVGFVIKDDSLWVYLRGDRDQVQEWKLSTNNAPEKGYCEVFEKKLGSKTQGDNISLLYKRKFDNLQEYQKRKKQRIEGHSK